MLNKEAIPNYKRAHILLLLCFGFDRYSMESQLEPSQSSHNSTLLGEEHKEEGLQEEEEGVGEEAMAMALASSSRHIPYMRSSLKYKMQACIDNSIQVAGPLYIALALTLISSVIYLFFTTVLPSMYNIYSLGGIIHTLISAWLIFNVFFNYYYCIKTNPGSPPESPDLLLHFNVHGRSSENAGEAILGRWCKRCQKPKPPMTHHCHICKRCILKMDHHCPWMNNCIGFYNYRFFFLFLFYMWIGCGYTVYMASIPLKTIEDEDFESGVLFTFLMALAVFISLTGLFWFHAYLISTAQTTIDFYAYRRQKRAARREARAKGVRFIAPRYVNEYDLGRLRNFKALFDRGGSYWWLLMFLPSSLPPKGNGLSFVKRNEMIQEGGPSLNGIPDPLRRRDGESNWPDEEIV